jgi:hypothetical protein
VQQQIDSKVTLTSINSKNSKQACCICHSNKCNITHPAGDSALSVGGIRGEVIDGLSKSNLSFCDKDGMNEVVNSKRTNRLQFIAVDTGRRNIVTLTEMAICKDGPPVVLRKSRLPKSFYLEITGNRLTKLMEELNVTKDVQEAEDYIAKHKLTIEMGEEERRKWLAANQIIDEAFMTTERSKLRERKRRNSQKNIDRYFINQFTQTFDGLKVNPENVIVLLGSAKFPSTAKGEHGGSPTTSIRNLLERLFPTVLIDEYYSSQKCSNCEHQLMEIRHDNRPIRDYRYCPNCRCNVDRDYNACVNITKAAVGWRIKDGKPEGRPAYLKK